MKLKLFIAALHAALLCLVLAVSPAGSGSMTLLGVGAPAAGGGGSPTVTYIGLATPTYVGNVATATGASIGTASADRLVVVMFFDMNNGANSTATVTIGGVSASVDTVANSTFNPVQGIASLNVTSGTTATIAVTYGAAGGFGTFQIYTITGLSSFSHVGASSNWVSGLANPISTTLATSAGGIVIAGTSNNFNPSAGSVSFPGSTESYTADANGFDCGHINTCDAAVARASGTSSNASSTVSATYSVGVGNHAAISAAAWR